MLLTGESTINALNEHATGIAGPVNPTRQAFASVGGGATPMRTSSAASISSQNRANYGWTNLGSNGFDGGAANVPLAQNPGNSNQRPRQPFHETQHVRSASTGHSNANHTKQGAHVNAIQAMPVRKNGGSGSAGSTTSGGSGGIGARGHANEINGGPAHAQNKMPEYLGQQLGVRQLGGQQRGGCWPFVVGHSI